MRSDMHKVIVERPRLLRSTWTNRKTALRLDANRSAQALDAGDDFDGGPHRASSSRHQKWLNENLAPLKRYLQKQVGRPWDKVYSEISQTIDKRSAVGLHVLQHVEDFVSVNAFVENGVVYEYDWGRGGALPVRGLYVHPVTRLLRSTKPVRRMRWVDRQPREELTLVPLSNTVAYQKIDGLWFLVEYQLAADASGLPRKELVRKQQCDRKTIQNIERGEFGARVDARSWLHGRWRVERR